MMFKKLIDVLNNLRGPKILLDPSKFNDPLAMNVSWEPLKRGGTNFCTHRLVIEDMTRARFKPAAGVWLFASLFLAMGAGTLFFVITSDLVKDTFDITNKNTFIPIIIGAVFALVGGVAVYNWTTPVIFDKGAGWFRRGRKRPETLTFQPGMKNTAGLSDIHALQIISEYCSSQKSSYYSYELNLVLKDGSRMNVVDHGNIRKLREDAGKLAEFLGVKIWDSVGT